MTMRRLICSPGAFVLACVTLVTVQAQRQGGGGAATLVLGPGNLITGACGENPLALHARSWGWMTKSYVSSNYKWPFWNKAIITNGLGQDVATVTAPFSTRNWHLDL
jgi:hypothetical protein